MYSPEFLYPKGFKINRPLQKEEQDFELKCDEPVVHFDEERTCQEFCVPGSRFS